MSDLNEKEKATSKLGGQIMPNTIVSQRVNHNRFWMSFLVVLNVVIAIKYVKTIMALQFISDTCINANLAKKFTIVINFFYFKNVFVFCSVNCI